MSDETLTVCAFGGAAAEDVAVVMKQLHDQLIRTQPLRRGPVRWLYGPGTAARNVIEYLEASQGALAHSYDDLLAWLDQIPGSVFVVAMVDVAAIRVGTAAVS